MFYLAVVGEQPAEKMAPFKSDTTDPEYSIWNNMTAWLLKDWIKHPGYYSTFDKYRRALYGRLVSINSTTNQLPCPKGHGLVCKHL